MKRYYCDVCNTDITKTADRNKLRIIECWDKSTYKRIICDDCLRKIFNILKGENNGK